jgi:hypothetical protein
LAAAAVTAALMVGGCEVENVRPVSPSTPGVVTVFFGAGNQGVLSACGCAQDPGGGLSKRQTVLAQMCRTRPNTLIVDAGDLFPERPNPLKARYVAVAVGRAKYDAIGLGDQEFALGVPLLQSMAREFGLPLICANVRDDAGSLVFPPHVVQQIGGLRVGIFAVIADQAFGTTAQDWRQGLKVESPAEAARREVKELADCDLVIALSHQSVAATQELVRSVPGIRLAVCGHDETVLKQPLKVGDSLVVATGDIGRWLGVFTFDRSSGGEPTTKMELAPLSPKVPDCKWVMGLYWEYVKKSKDAPIPSWALTPVPDAYESAEACGKCHQEEYNQWLTTKHALAHDTIERVHKQDDPECILCHTMGYGRDGGFISMTKTMELGRVTCQACHSFTSQQCPKQASQDPKYDPKVAINSRLCQSCHGLVESPNFDYAPYKSMILHKFAAAKPK